MIEEAIYRIVDKKDLTYEEAYEVINEIMSGKTTQVQTAAFLAALSTKSTKSETIDEIAGCAAAMRSHARKFHYDAPLLEIVGTGGDKAGSFNISTTAAFVIASGGIKVAKHGNRAASSKSGTADCQEALGVQIRQSPEVCKKLLDTVGLCFFFAQEYHTAMKYVGPIRKELGIRTVFNILGPLTNPASPKRMILGVYDGSLVEPLAHVLVSLGVKDGMVVFGEAVLDELSCACPTKVCEFHGDVYRTYMVHPEDFGMARCSIVDLEGGTPEENAQITRDILEGVERGAKRDTVLLNAGAGLYLAGKADGLAEGIEKAAKLIDEGTARSTLDAYIAASNAAGTEA
jgi:anthranilate phosphoribosyltransferase